MHFLYAKAVISIFKWITKLVFELSSLIKDCQLIYNQGISYSWCFGLGMVLVRSESGQLLMIPQQTLAQMQAQAQAQAQERTTTPTNVAPGQVWSHWLPRVTGCQYLLVELKHYFQLLLRKWASEMFRKCSCSPFYDIMSWFVPFPRLLETPSSADKWLPAPSSVRALLLQQHTLQPLPFTDLLSFR